MRLPARLEHDHRHRAVRQDALRHAASECASEPRAPVRRHHDQIRTRRLRRGDDLLGGVSAAHEDVDLQVTARQLVSNCRGSLLGRGI